jgi:hypothetical protein
MRRGQSLVVWAITEGRRAARGVDEFLMGESHLRWSTLVAQPLLAVPVRQGCLAARKATGRSACVTENGNPLQYSFPWFRLKLVLEALQEDKFNAQ